MCFAVKNILLNIPRLFNLNNVFLKAKIENFELFWGSWQQSMSSRGVNGCERRGDLSYSPCATCINGAKLIAKFASSFNWVVFLLVMSLCGVTFPGHSASNLNI